MKVRAGASVTGMIDALSCFSMSRAASILASLLLTTIAAPGCAMLAVPALGSAAASGSAGALTRAGASAMKGGTVYRTFDAPLRAMTPCRGRSRAWSSRAPKSR
jgi:hypothetical protein